MGTPFSWLHELSSTHVAQEHHLIEENGGFSKLSGRGGGFVTQFLGHGDDTDLRWELTSPPQLPQPCKVVGYQLRFAQKGRAVGGARFQFANVPSTEGEIRTKECKHLLLFFYIFLKFHAACWTLFIRPAGVRHAICHLCALCLCNRPCTDAQMPWCS